MMEIWEEEGEQNSEWRDGPGDEIGSDSVLECIRNFPMYSPPRSLTDWRADQVQSPPLDLFGLQFGYEAYLPPATTTVSNIEVSLGYEASLFGVQFEYESHLKEKSTTDRPKRKYMTAYLITTTDDLRQLFGHKREDAAKTLGGAKNIAQKVKSWKCRKELHRSIAFIEEKYTIETPKRKYRTKCLITLYDLRQVFGLKRVDAAKTLVVSVATFKPYRRRRRKGIKWWNGLVELKLLNNSVHQNSSGSNPPEVPGEKEISTLSGARQDAVTVMAKYGEGCWIGAEMNHIVQFLKVKESNAQGYSLEGRCVKPNNVMDEKLNSGVQYNQTFERWPGVEIIQLDSSEERIFGELGAKNIGQKVGSAEKSCIAISHSKKKNTIETPKRKYRTKRSITLDDLRPLFGQKRVDAAKTLGVSESTFKRHCRQNGITWWNGDGCPLVEPMLVNNSVQQNSSGSKPPEVQGEKEISALLGARQDAVTIKAKYGEVNLKFQLSSESRFAELQKAVAKRLKSKAFIVEYEDEDQEPIMITCDEDWQACVKFFGNQVIRLAIRETISSSKKSHASGRGLKRKMS